MDGIHNNNVIADVVENHFMKQPLDWEPEKMVKMRENSEIFWKFLCDTASRWCGFASWFTFHLAPISEKNYNNAFNNIWGNQ